MNGTSLMVAAKKRRTGSADRRPRLQYTVPKPGDGKEEGPSMLNERNCGPAHLRRARPSIRMRDLLVESEEFLCQTKECATRIVSQTWYQGSWHPTKFNPSQCDALLCAGLAFGGYAKPVLEQVLRSIRKLAAEPTETVGWWREWAVCAPANKSHPGLGRGRVAAQPRAFFGHENLRD